LSNSSKALRIKEYGFINNDFSNFDYQLNAINSLDHVLLQSHKKGINIIFVGIT